MFYSHESKCLFARPLAFSCSFLRAFPNSCSLGLTFLKYSPHVPEARCRNNMVSRLDAPSLAPISPHWSVPEAVVVVRILSLNEFQTQARRNSGSEDLV
jgi:hypothetical protein